jgi:hypothetical protein
MVDDEDKYRADYSYHDARQVHASNARESERAEDCASDDRPYDAQQDVPHQSFPSAIHDFATDKASDEPDDQP